MSVTAIDRNPAHLYPEFRTRLERAQRAAEARIKAELGISDTLVYAETLRTQERQTYLYAQGRTRPGAKVTWIRSPRFHGIGMAADHVFKQRGYSVPNQAWVILREESIKQGLFNPAWSAGDFGHVQWDPKDKATLAKASAWVRAGMKAPVPSVTPSDLRIFVNGGLIPDSDGFIESDRIWVAVRPIADDLRVVIAEVEPTRALLIATDWEAPAPADVVPPQTGVEGQSAWVALQNRGGTGFVLLKSLERFASRLTWDEGTRTAKLWD